jgi:hypothetical protein
VDARLETPTAAERVSRAEKAHLHESPFQRLMISCRP